MQDCKANIAKPDDNINNMKKKRTPDERKNTTEGNVQCHHHKYENENIQCTECIQIYQHIRQWCASRRHNSQPIGLFVLPGVFSSTTLPATSELVSSMLSHSIWLVSVGWSVTTFSTSTGWGSNSVSQLQSSLLVLLLLILGTGVFSMLTLTFRHSPDHTWSSRQVYNHCQHHKE